MIVLRVSGTPACHWCGRKIVWPRRPLLLWMADGYRYAWHRGCHRRWLEGMHT